MEVRPKEVGQLREERSHSDAEIGCQAGGERRPRTWKSCLVRPETVINAGCGAEEIDREGLSAMFGAWQHRKDAVRALLARADHSTYDALEIADWVKWLVRIWEMPVTRRALWFHEKLFIA